MAVPDASVDHQALVTALSPQVDLAVSSAVSAAMEVQTQAITQQLSGQFAAITSSLSGLAEIVKESQAHIIGLSTQVTSIASTQQEQGVQLSQLNSRQSSLETEVGDLRSQVESLQNGGVQEIVKNMGISSSQGGPATTNVLVATFKGRYFADRQDTVIMADLTRLSLQGHLLRLDTKNGEERAFITMDASTSAAKFVNQARFAPMAHTIEGVKHKVQATYDFKREAVRKSEEERASGRIRKALWDKVEETCNPNEDPSRVLGYARRSIVGTGGLRWTIYLGIRNRTEDKMYYVMSLMTSASGGPVQLAVADGPYPTEFSRAMAIEFLTSLSRETGVPLQAYAPITASGLTAAPASASQPVGATAANGASPGVVAGLGQDTSALAKVAQGAASKRAGLRAPSLPPKGVIGSVGKMVVGAPTPHRNRRTKQQGESIELARAGLPSNASVADVQAVDAEAVAAADLAMGRAATDNEVDAQGQVANDKGIPEGFGSAEEEAASFLHVGISSRTDFSPSPPPLPLPPSPSPSPLACSSPPLFLPSSRPLRPSTSSLGSSPPPPRHHTMDSPPRTPPPRGRRPSLSHTPPPPPQPAAIGAHNATRAKTMLPVGANRNTVGRALEAQMREQDCAVPPPAVCAPPHAQHPPHNKHAPSQQPQQQQQQQQQHQQQQQQHRQQPPLRHRR